MKNKEVLEVIDKKIKEFNNVKYALLHMDLEDAYNRLEYKCKELKDRVKFLESKRVKSSKPFTLYSYDVDISLHELEKRYIQNAVKHFEGNKTQVAHALGITIKTLYNKLHEYGMFDE